jgi:cold-inducible RNA-binding protein
MREIRVRIARGEILGVLFREEGSVKLYVGNLNYDTDDEGLKKAFAEFGEVESVDIVIDRYTGRSKGFGFVQMPDDQAAQKAIEGLDGKDLDGRSLRVEAARPRTERRDSFKDY